MSVALLERSAPASAAARRRAANPKVEALIGTAVRLALDPMLDGDGRVRELREASGQDPRLLGRAWIHASIDLRRHPSRTAAEVEHLLRSVLEVETVPEA